MVIVNAANLVIHGLIVVLMLPMLQMCTAACCGLTKPHKSVDRSTEMQMSGQVELPTAAEA